VNLLAQFVRFVEASRSGMLERLTLDVELLLHLQGTPSPPRLIVLSTVQDGQLKGGGGKTLPRMPIERMDVACSGAELAVLLTNPVCTTLHPAYWGAFITPSQCHQYNTAFID
jgi:hypothetical protein